MMIVTIVKVLHQFNFVQKLVLKNFPASGTYILNGVTYSWSLNAFSATSICAKENSVTISTGQPVIQQTVNECTSPRECRLPIAQCNKLLFSNDSGQTVNYTYTNCDGRITNGLLSPGASFTDCVRSNPTPIISGGGTITNLMACQ